VSPRETAIAAARAAGDVLRRHYGALLNVDERKRRDLKLEVDRLAEQAIVETIRRAHPEHRILAEEGGQYPGAGEHVWICDPLDGTVNFFHGLPYFCTAVACHRAPAGPVPAAFPRGIEALGQPVVGVVYMPLLDELFVGAPGEAATCNGRPIHVSRVTALEECIVVAGCGSKEENIRRMQEVQALLLTRVRKTRCLGAANYDFANVACGRLSAFYERGLKSWDVAAGRIILESAGGVLSAREYAANEWEILASGPGVHAELRKLLGSP
jgi:myo-inositol-1(or 4)-monophosphatase